MNWGKGIVLSFVLFAVFVITLVVVCFRQEVSLVSQDYYQKELLFQDQIDGINNAAGLDVKPEVDVLNGQLSVRFGGAIDRGEIQLFRPSDSKMDRRFVITPSEEDDHLFSLQGLPGGMYKVRISWSHTGKKFFIEKTVQL